jgi:hypothetical protein
VPCSARYGVSGRTPAESGDTVRRHPDARDERKDLGGRNFPAPRSFWLGTRPQDDPLQSSRLWGRDLPFPEPPAPIPLQGESERLDVPQPLLPAAALL